MPRAIILVLDSVGIGGAPDAADYGDEGADTVGHIASAAAAGLADRSGLRSGPLSLANLGAMGLGAACRLATGVEPPGLPEPDAAFAWGTAVERSRGKDTPSGHWEIAGLPIVVDWGYFPRAVPCFPPRLIGEVCRRAELPGILGDCHASGTEIIAELGTEHMQTGKPICYTSADSVFQIAAHEQTFGLDRLYSVCEIARGLLDELRIGRVIARPFRGTDAASFVRTANRRDYAVPPDGPTLLDRAAEAGRDVITVGKIADIFAHTSTGRVLKGPTQDALFDQTLSAIAALSDGGLLLVNYVDFDALYGHRRDVPGYAAALEAFDRRLPEILERLRPDDMLVLTADHGCDPTWTGTDHTREQVPVLCRLPSYAGPLGRRSSFADIGAAAARHLGLPATVSGQPFP